jgi:hypothetical protein
LFSQKTFFAKRIAVSTSAITIPAVSASKQKRLSRFICRRQQDSLSQLVFQNSTGLVHFMTEPRNLTIDGDRLWNSIMEIAKIGATESRKPHVSTSST